MSVRWIPQYEVDRTSLSKFAHLPRLEFVFGFEKCFATKSWESYRQLEDENSPLVAYVYGFTSTDRPVSLEVPFDDDYGNECMLHVLGHVNEIQALRDLHPLDLPIVGSRVYKIGQQAERGEYALKASDPRGFNFTIRESNDCRLLDSLRNELVNKWGCSNVWVGQADATGDWVVETVEGGSSRNVLALYPYRDSAIRVACNISASGDEWLLVRRLDLPNSKIYRVHQGRVVAE